MDYLLGIDLGSTSLKAVVYDLAGHVVARGSRPTRKFHPHAEHPEWTVWEPQQIWGDTAAAVREAVGALDDPRKIRGVAVTGMGMDGLPVDGEGRWLYPLISWHDPRTIPQLEWWQAHIGAEKVFSIAGNPLWPINSALRILWVKENEPEVYGRTEKWLLIEDFLNFMLCGRQVTDYSMASCTLLFDLRKLQWSEELMELSGIPRRLLCDVAPSGTPVGEVHAAAARATGLPEGTPVILGGHDHLCGALPVGGFRPGVAMDVTGTWESVVATTDQPVLRDDLRRRGMTVQAHVARGRYATWGGNVAAEMLEWYRAQFGRPAAGRPEGGGSDWDHLMQAARSAPAGSRRVFFLPHMSGANCPVVDPQSLGAWVGLSVRATAADLLRAMIEGLDYQFLDIVAALESGLGIQLERVVAVGGATRNEFWMQNKADVSGRPVEVPAVDEATPLGAAILAGIGLGIYQDEEDAYQRVYKPGRTYRPDPEAHKRYAESFRVYQQLYPTLAPLHHQLARIPTT